MNNFAELKQLIKQQTQVNDFNSSCQNIENFIAKLSFTEFIPIITEIGTIPEDIRHDSTEEKLYAKTTDIVLSKCFQFLGLKSSVISQRANCADVIAKSIYHNYSLVADAKAFRLSRTAKNQKDFKVESMVHWKYGNDYSVLVCPYFQYPKIKSQIFGQALNGNVLLFSWEDLSVLLNSNIQETPCLNLSDIWNLSKIISENTNVAECNTNFIEKQNELICDITNINRQTYCNYFSEYKKQIIHRGRKEIEFWTTAIADIKKYSREQAISELISSLKLNEKIKVIQDYIYSLGTENEKQRQNLLR